VTGLPSDKDFLIKVAASISNEVRNFNIREGLSRMDDRLPPRFHREPLPSGQVITEEELSTMLSEYYQLRGWDKKGIPI
jgi:aldehyde:ferredoxin oxidoreductase